MSEYITKKAESPLIHTKGFRLLAHPARFERATFRLGGGRSIRLSYGRMSSFYLDFSGRKEYIPYIALCQGCFWNLRLCLVGLQ